MGLNTTHDCLDGAYSKFNRFRYSLGYQIGFDLDDYLGYEGKKGKKLEDIDHDLMPLFNHSDCDGILTIEESKKIANGLNLVLENFNEELEFDYDFKERVIQFRDGCLWAIENNQIVEFY